MLNRAHLTDALWFWEIARVPYNLALAGATVLCVNTMNAWPAPTWAAWGPALALLVVLAAVANLLYCAAYPVDLVIQASDLREPWRRWRWVLWLIGTAIGVSLSYLTMMGVAGFTF